MALVTRLHKGRVRTAGSHEDRVRPGLNDPAAVHHQDQVRVLHRGQAVRDREHGRGGELRPNRSLDKVVCETQKKGEEGRQDEANRGRGQAR